MYELTTEQYEYLLAIEPPNMYPSDVISTGSEAITAILYPRELVEQYNWLDISNYGGWAAYKQAVSIGSKV